jgi:aspartyl-tRNA(Asn)/glutamyl-tRNA(Gln) amidotransferase subunit A
MRSSQRGSIPADLGVVEAARLIRRGDLSPDELTRSCLDRAHAYDGVIGAFVTLDSDGALEQARRLTAELGRSGPRGPLHGIPVAIKDLIDVAGLPTTANSKLLEGNVASKDAAVVTRLRDAGAVILGKTATHEFAYGVVTPSTRNPWDTSRIPGGSSGGSAAAVAVGMCLAALGTDTAGSIRIPAALCGVSGLRPRRLTIPMEGIVPLAPSLDSCGPIGRSVADLSLVYEAIAHSPTDAGGRRPARLGVLRSTAEVTGAQPEILAVVQDASARLSESGMSLVEVDLPPFSEWDLPRSIPLMSEALEVHRSAGWYPDGADGYSDETLSALRYAESFDHEKLESSRAALPKLVARLTAVFETVDVLALPVTPMVAPKVEAARARDQGHRTPVTRTLTRLCGPINVCDLAAVSVMCGTGEGGMPVGLQLVARDEASALRAASEYQSASDWHERRFGSS